MLNNFIGGGQVFLHKIRMFQQVLTRTISAAFLLGVIASVSLYSEELRLLDWPSIYSYRKAVIADEFDAAINKMRMSIGKKPTYISYISVKTKSGIAKTNIDPRIARDFYIFKNAHTASTQLAKQILIAASIAASLIFIMIFFIWSRFGKNLKAETSKEGANRILTAKEVAKQLRKMGKASDLKIGDMPLVKNMETQHFLVTGSTGSGKTNLMHNLLPQIEKRADPAIVIDNTGEMIAKYYNPERGDIIFNPFDSRSKAWDFWSDCSNPEELERFSKILFSFNRKKSASSSDPFWEQSAEIVFNACVEYLINNDSAKMSSLKNMVLDANLGTLQHRLRGTQAERYLSDEGKGLASSVLSTLATNAKPMSYLTDHTSTGKFSLKEHFQEIKSGSNAWLFLATKPSSRQLTSSLIACLTELVLCQLLDIGIKEDRRLWFIIDELASLGRLPALPTLMSEGRKYGSCIICGLQSLNQLYSLYGQYEGSSIFGQFGTSFFFRNTETIIAKQVSALSGMTTITRQQKNTSFGANEFRDGISYNEHQQKKLLIEPSDLSSLATGQCYTFLPEPQVRMVKLQTLQATPANKNESFSPQIYQKSEDIESNDITHTDLQDTHGYVEGDDQNAVRSSKPQLSTENNIAGQKKNKNRLKNSSTKARAKAKSKTPSIETTM